MRRCNGANTRSKTSDADLSKIARCARPDRAGSAGATIADPLRDTGDASRCERISGELGSDQNPIRRSGKSRGSSKQDRGEKNIALSMSSRQRAGHIAGRYGCSGCD